MAANVKICQFNPDELSFEVYLNLFEAHLATNEITDDAKKKNYLFVSVGAKVFGTLANLTAPDMPTTKTYAELIDLLKGHYVTKPSYHRSLVSFQQRRKVEGESLKELYADLKRLAKDCNFGATFDSRLRDQLFMAVDRLPFFKFLLAEDLNLDGLTSAKLLDRIQTLEKAHVGEGTVNFEVNKIRDGKRFMSQKCKHCGFPHNSADCRFKNLTCRSCEKKGHLERVCRFKKNEAKYQKNKDTRVKIVKESVQPYNVSNENESLDQDEMLLNVEDDNDILVNSVKPEMFVFELNNRKVPLEVDTGACVSLLSEDWVKHLKVKTKPTEKKLSAYGGKKVTVNGEVSLNVKFNNNIAEHIFYVTDLNCNNLCGRDLMKKLDIKLIGLNENLRVNAIQSRYDITQLLNQYKINENLPISEIEAKIHIKDDYVPKYFKARPVPLAHKDLVEEALQELINDNIIEPVAFSDCASPIVPVLKKNGKMRICCDLKYLNTQINIEKYPLPKLDEMLAVIGDNKIFSKLDLCNAYLQIPVAKKDQELLVVSTEKGLFKYLRLPFGLASAPGIFQRFISQLLSNIDGVIVYLDDILICSKTPTDQFNKLKIVLNILQEANVKLNLQKCKFNQSKIDFLGYVISEKGLSPSEDKVKAVLDAPVPQNVQELQSFLGLVTYYSRFIHRFSDILAPLYNLTKKNTRFVWDRKCEIAYDLIKKSLCNSNVLTCFTGKHKIILETDASPVGVGCVLIQVENNVEKPIAFASKMLTSAEKNYSQTDREALGLVFGVTKFKYFLLGRNFELRTDHKTLLGLFGRGKSISTDSNARLVRWSVLLSQYSYDLTHKKGKVNYVADALSRLPISDDIRSQVPMEYVKMIQSLDFFDFSFKTVQNLTRNDSVLSKIISYVKFGWPNNDRSCNEYSKFKKDLSIYDNVLLFRNRIVVPSELRANVLSILHSGHNGIVAMKAEARQSIWWPNLSVDIEELARSCNDCCINNKQCSEPKLVWNFASKPWSRLHIDYCGPIDNKYFLIIIDSFSKFLDVYCTSSMTSSTTIELLRKCFCNFGVPDSIVSDNAPYFVSAEIKDFYERNGIKLINPAPFHPASNGLAERAVRTFKQGIPKFQNGTMNTRLCRFLYNYRKTIHSRTNKSPAEIMFGRSFKSSLDICRNSNKKLEEYKMMQSPNFIDFEENKYSVGQAVFARNFAKGESWLPAVIVEIVGSRNYVVKVINKAGHLIWRRHSDQIKPRFNNVCFNNAKSNSDAIPPDNNIFYKLLDVPITTPVHVNKQTSVVPPVLPENINTEGQKAATNAETNIPPSSPPAELSLRRSTRIKKSPSRYVATM